MENDTYVFKEGDFSDEHSYQNKRLVGFVNSLIYLASGVPSVEADKKHLSRLIDIPLLIEARSCEVVKLSLISLKHC